MDGWETRRGASYKEVVGSPDDGMGRFQKGLQMMIKELATKRSPDGYIQQPATAGSTDGNLRAIYSMVSR